MRESVQHDGAGATVRIGPRMLIGPWWPARSAAVAVCVGLLAAWGTAEPLRDSEPASALLLVVFAALLIAPIVNVLRRTIVVDADGISYRSLQAWRTRRIPWPDVADIVTVAAGEVHDPRVAVLHPDDRIETIAISRHADDVAEILRASLLAHPSPSHAHEAPEVPGTVARPAALIVNDASTVTEMSLAIGALAAAVPVQMALVTLPSPRWPTIVALAAAGVAAVLAASIRYLRPVRNIARIDHEAIAVIGWGSEGHVPVVGSRLALQEASRTSTESPTLVALHGKRGIPIPIPLPKRDENTWQLRLAGRPKDDLAAAMRERVEAFNRWHAAGGSTQEPTPPLDVMGWKPPRAPHLMRASAVVLIVAGGATMAAAIGVGAEGALDRAAMIERSEVAWVEVLEVDCHDDADSGCDVIIEAVWHPEAATAQHDVSSRVDVGDLIPVAHDPTDPDLFWPPDHPRRLGADAATKSAALLAAPFMLVWLGTYLWFRATPPHA